MSYAHTSYAAKPIDRHGIAAYTEEDHAVWQTLIKRQSVVIQNRACDEYVHGLHKLNLSKTQIPQCPDISHILRDITGWSLEPVPALISFDRFFELLANRKFPAATFIRTKEDMDYLKEPDIFHEIFGHCPLLTNSAYAAFVQEYGRLGLLSSKEERVWLARLFWFTIEFGLIQTTYGLRAYGGGILSSIAETVYCLENPEPKRLPFDVLQVLRTPYRIDIIQPIYFVLHSFDQLYHLIDLDLMGLIRQAQQMGEICSPLHPC